MKRISRFLLPALTTLANAADPPTPRVHFFGGSENRLATRVGPPGRRRGCKVTRSIATAALLSLASLAFAQEPTADFPQFGVPGHEVETKALNELHSLHHGAAFSDCTLWDPWLPLATLWTGQKPRDRYRASFLNRRIDAEGCVSVQQHRGKIGRAHV